MGLQVAVPEYIEIGTIVKRRIVPPKDGSFITLGAVHAASATDFGSGLFNTATGTQYQVPVGFQLRLVGAQALVIDVDTQGRIGFNYSDNAVGTQAATAFTNPVTYGGLTGVGNPCFLDGQIAGNLGEGMDFVIPAGKYPNVFTSTAAAALNFRILVFGILEPV